jgi:hypothetical protein
MHLFLDTTRRLLDSNQKRSCDQKMFDLVSICDTLTSFTHTHEGKWQACIRTLKKVSRRVLQLTVPEACVCARRGASFWSCH